MTLQNTGAAALSISGIVASGDFAQTNSCGVSLAASATCTITVTFTPTLVGARSGSISVSSNAAGSPHAVALSGTGTAAAPPPSQPPAAIPTLSEWALLLTSLLVGVIALRRRQAFDRRR